MFVVVGERINTSRKKVYEAVEQRNVTYIQEDVQKQQEAGAIYIDVNAGAFIDKELEVMEWLLEVVQEVATIPMCLDSPDPKVLEKAMDLVKEPPMINSISLEKDRYEAMLPFLEGRDCSVVALCMDDTGMPASSGEVIERAGRLVEGLEKVGIKRQNIYADPLVQPVSTDVSKGVMTIEAVRGIMQRYTGVHTICGLSNISYGLPQRKIANRTFLSLLMAAGLDGAIIDPMDDKIMAALKTADMILGRDDYCMNYIKAVRAGQILS